jgi:hypothetical protein
MFDVQSKPSIEAVNLIKMDTIKVSFSIKLTVFLASGAAEP